MDTAILGLGVLFSFPVFVVLVALWNAALRNLNKFSHLRFDDWIISFFFGAALAVVWPVSVLLVIAIGTVSLHKWILFKATIKRLAKQ